jgi:hypothetical protein
MTDIQTATPDVLTGDSLEHFVCCLHADVTYCGAPADDSEPAWADEVECVVCNDLERTLGAGYCPTSTNGCRYM